MSRRRIVVLSLLAVILLLVTIHVSINGLDLGSWNPHGK